MEANTMFKKLTAVFLVFVLAIVGLSLAGCNNTDDETTAPTDESTEATVEEVKYRILPDGLFEEEYAIGFRKADQTLRDKVQTVLAEMKEDGTLAEIAIDWFGDDTTTVNATPTTIVEDADDDSLQKVLDSGKLILGLDATFKPMGFTDDNDEIVGFDIDVAKVVCERLEIELELKPIDWGTKEATLDAGTIDCIWNGMSISDERAEAMNLSEAYMDNKMVFVVAGDSETENAEALAGKKVAVQSGSTAQTLLTDSEYGDTVEIVELGTNVECLQQLDLDMVDAVFLDLVVAEYEILQLES